MSDNGAGFSFAAFWGVAALAAFAGWCVLQALIGLTPEAQKRWENVVVFWTGRVLVALAAFATVLGASYGLMRLVQWLFLR